MSTRITRFSAAAAAACTIATTLLPGAAHAQSAGPESMTGVLVVSGTSGVRRVVSSTIVARGVFTGVGRVVERDNMPGDPDSVSRDDLVFADGTLHIVNTNLDFSVQLDPKTCQYTVVAKQHSRIEDGTGRFAHASGDSTATVRAHGLGSRHADGSCAEDQAPVFEEDELSSAGTLSF
jgi:hypothetical protein